MSLHGSDAEGDVSVEVDSKIGRAAARSRWGELLAGGAEFYLYEPAMYHAKSMLVDDVMLTIGSSNFDNRSFSINDEVTLTVIDKKVAAENLRIFEDDIRHSKLRVEVVLAGELVAVFDAGNGISLRILRPVAQVAVNLDPCRRIGDAD